MVRFGYEMISGETTAACWPRDSPSTSSADATAKPTKLPEKYRCIRMNSARQNHETMSTLSIRDLDLEGKRVFMRVDFNVPLAPGGKEITSDKRIRASLPSIQYALDHGAAA